MKLIKPLLFVAALGAIALCAAPAAVGSALTAASVSLYKAGEYLKNLPACEDEEDDEYSVSDAEECEA